MHTKKKVLLILLIIAILAVVVGAGLYSSRGHSAPDLVVNRFYDSWIAALTDSKGPIEQRLHEKSTYVTEEFGRTVARENERGRDAVLCGATEPVNYYALRARQSEDGSRASVDFMVNDTEGHAVLERDSRGWWRISEVDCPKPVEAAPVATSTATTTPAE